MPKSEILVRFVLVGGATACLYAVLLVAGVEGAGLPPAAGAGLAYVLAVGFNYWAHHRWTYRTDRPHRSSGPRYVLVVVSLLLVNVAFTAAVPRVADVGYGAVQLSFALICALATFVSLGRWVFNRRLPPALQQPEGTPRTEREG